MRYILIICLLAIVNLALFSCIKYKSPIAKPSPKDTTRYCDDPNAVNYNWGFPGKPDSTVCFYPTDVFAGVYRFRDSIFLVSSGLFVHSDTLILTISRISQTKFNIAGFCPSGSRINLTAGVNFTATIDTTVGDTTTDISGQILCGVADTINGSMTKNPLDDSIMYINFVVSSDTGVFTNHTGTAFLIHK